MSEFGKGRIRGGSSVSLCFTDSFLCVLFPGYDWSAAQFLEQRATRLQWGCGDNGRAGPGAACGPSRVVE